MTNDEKSINLAENKRDDENRISINSDKRSGNKNNVDAGKSTGNTSQASQRGETKEIRGNDSRASVNTQDKTEREGLHEERSGRDNAKPISTTGKSGRTTKDVGQRDDQNTKRSKSLNNHVINPDDVIVPRGETAKIRANINAIKFGRI
ncbi:MAG: hypothetical protein JEZ03_17195 [Bacteroidales bacterium]|nr:hypothetical protein [Bacteroidales bacterium]